MRYFECVSGVRSVMWSTYTYEKWLELNDIIVQSNKRVFNSSPDTPHDMSHDSKQNRHTVAACELVSLLNFYQAEIWVSRPRFVLIQITLRPFFRRNSSRLCEWVTCELERQIIQFLKFSIEVAERDSLKSLSKGISTFSIIKVLQLL